MATVARRRPGGARPNGPLLERDQIVEEATRLTAEAGLSSVSMRLLGDRLGVTSMAIYWYLKNRQELVDAIAEQVCSQIVADPMLPWDEWIRAVALSAHTVLSAHAGVPDHLLSAAPLPPSVLALSTGGVERLTEAGIPRATAVVALEVLGTFVAARAQLDAHRRLTGCTEGPTIDPDAVLHAGIDQAIEGLRGHAAS